MMRYSWILIFICQNLKTAELKGAGAVNTTYTEWKYVSDSIARTVRHSQTLRDIVKQEQCNSDFESSHFQHTHKKLPCTLGAGLAWVRIPPNVGAGRAGHLSHWSPVQVEAARCRGACQVHLLSKKNKKQM
jgi:hypothetical protein